MDPIFELKTGIARNGFTFIESGSRGIMDIRHEHESCIQMVAMPSIGFINDHVHIVRPCSDPDLAITVNGGIEGPVTETHSRDIEGINSGSADYVDIEMIRPRYYRPIALATSANKRYHSCQSDKDCFGIHSILLHAASSGLQLDISHRRQKSKKVA